jgi:peptidoglycan/LPS O-acetylase OafA/YrhL
MFMKHDMAQPKVMREDVQALRALAVLAVVVCHMNPGWLPGGYLGVDIFFVISGFVITQTLLAGHSVLNFRQFWVQRFFRIFPAYAVMLIVVAFCAALIFLPENFGQFSRSWLYGLSFLSNQYFAGYGDYFSPAMTEQPLLHTWSLAVEMQFYLLYPLMLWLVLRHKAFGFLVMATVLGFALAMWSWQRGGTSTALYYALHIRVPEFLLGGSLAAYTSQFNGPCLRRHAVWVACVGLAVLGVCLYVIDAQRFDPAMAAVVCLGTGLVLVARVDKGWLLSIFKWRFVGFLGALSYSLYLWHWPVLAFFRYASGEIDWTPGFAVAYLTGVGVLAWLSWVFIENRFRLRSRGSDTAALKKLAVLLMAIGTPVAFARHLNLSVPSLPTEFTRYADDKTICHGKLLPSCVRGDRSSADLLLIGDSHAAQLNLAADVAGRQLGVGFEVISASSCVPLSGFNVAKLPVWARAACQSQINVVADKLLSAKKVVLAGMWSYQLQDETFAAVLRHFLSAASAKGQSVWILAQVPKLTHNPRRTARLGYLGIKVPAHLDTDWLKANQQLAQIVAEQSAVHFIDLSRAKMFAAPPLDNGALIYHDEHHLNEIGSARYGVLLADALTAGLKP